MDIKNVLRPTFTRELLLETYVLVPFEQLRGGELHTSAQINTYHFQELMDLECLRVDHLEAQERLLLHQM